MAKNIILCSDGTGNSGGQSNGTNVWRLYRAIDQRVAPPAPLRRQVAFHDDGVGTESFKYLRMLGGAFGWGISRNLRTLYAFLIKNYEPGDDIYLFGFSRGAFTVRVLAEMIYQCGIPCSHVHRPGEKPRERTPSEVAALAAEALSAYKQTKRDWFGSDTAAADFRQAHTLDDVDGPPRPVPIKCVGVWDTVDAVGLPIGELTAAFRWLFPLRFRGHELNESVENGIQALSIDDARTTFHPILWEPAPHILQVWFMGVHANVGGGYPKDQVAMVTLNWMIEQAAAIGADDATRLRFDEAAKKEFEREATLQGKLYDSRAGLGSYYRYGPRQLDKVGEHTCLTPGFKHKKREHKKAITACTKIMNAPATTAADADAARLVKEKHELALQELRKPPKVHASVLWRIYEDMDGYAPAGIPARYEIVGDSQIPADSVPRLESPEHRVARMRHLQLCQDYIWWRKVSYYVFLVCTVAIVAFGWVLAAEPPHVLHGPVADFLEWLAAIAPWGFANIAEGYAKNPEILMLFLMVYLAGLPRLWIWVWTGFILFVGYMFSYEDVTTTRNAIASILEFVRGFTPWPFKDSVMGYEKNPQIFMALMLMFLVVLVWSVYLRSRIVDLASDAWHLGFGQPIVHGKKQSRGAGAMARARNAWRQMPDLVHGSIARYCRTAPWVAKVAHVFKAHLLPPLTLLAVIPFVTWLVRLAWFAVALPSAVPTPLGELSVVRDGVSLNTDFDSQEPYWPTKWKVLAGEHYRLVVAPLRTADLPAGDVNPAPWRDGALPATPAGLEPPVPRLLWLGVPLRRASVRPWFELHASIGPSDQVQIPIGRGAVFTADYTGELFLWVNDAPGKYWNNRGTAKVTILHVPREEWRGAK